MSRVRLRRTWRAGRSRTAVTCVGWRGTRMEYATRGRFGSQNHRMDGLRVWASKPGRRFRGGTDDTWRHRGVRVEAKLPVSRRGGHRIKITLGWTTTPLGLAVQLICIQGQNWKCVIALLNRVREPHLPHLSHFSFSPF